MLDLIKKEVFAKYKPNDVLGVFLSSFDKNNIMLGSNGVLSPEKELNQVIDLIYNGLFVGDEKNIFTIVVDVVINYNKETDIQKVMTIKPHETGICLINEDNTSKSGVLLPNTKGIEDIKQAILLIKQKYNIDGNVVIYSFTTDRIVVILKT